MILRIIGVLALIVVAADLYIRLAPSDPVRWHRWDLPPMGAGDYPMPNGFVAVGGVAGPQVLARLDAIIMATPRTSRLAGSVDAGMITYVTRSRLWGFPDYTTVRLTQRGEAWVLAIKGRSRFGKSDLGVNKARIDGWLAGITLTKP
mgnify:CR=1 FL=1